MNNFQNLSHAVDLRRTPNAADARQKAFDVKRFARIEKAVATRPAYLPMTFNLLAASQMSAYTDETPQLAYDVIITGIITNITQRQVVLRDAYKDLPYAITGEKTNLKLTLADIAGGTPDAVKGQKGIFNLPSPIIIRAGNRLYAEIYKPDATADAEVLSIVFVGYRVSKNYSLDNAQKSQIAEAIANRKLPKTVFLKQEIVFDSAVAGGTAKNIYTPPCSEPLLIRGCRSSLRQSLVNVRIEGEPEWTVKDAPIWAIAAPDDNEKDSYVWFQRPVFLEKNLVIEMSLKNSIDGTNIDAQTNEITWICETM